MPRDPLADELLAQIDRENDAIIRRVMARDDAPSDNGRPDRTFRFISDDTWAALPPPPWLVQGWLPMGSLAVLFGASGTGKSFVALELAYAIGRGVPWLDQPVEQPGPVLYLAGEAGVSLRARCAAYRAYHGVNGPAGVHIVPDLVRLAEASDVNLFTQLATAQWPDGVRLIIVDTLAAMCAGLLDENSSQEMTQALTALAAMQRRLGAAIVVIHHTGWSTTKRERGSSALRAAWDVAMSLSNEGMGIQLTVPKARDFEQGMSIPIRLLPTGASAVVLREDRPPEQRPLVDMERALLRCLYQTGGSDGLSVTEWWQASELPRASFYRARKRLLQFDAVACDKRRYRVTPLGQSILETVSII